MGPVNLIRIIQIPLEFKRAKYYSGNLLSDFRYDIKFFIPIRESIKNIPPPTIENQSKRSFGKPPAMPVLLMIAT